MRFIQVGDFSFLYWIYGPVSELFILIEKLHLVVFLNTLALSVRAVSSLITFYGK